MIATIGEALVDLIEQADGRFQACLGGSVCNFSVALARQCAPVSYLNPLSEDKFGGQFLSLLSDNGVHLVSDSTSSCPTSLAIVSVDEHGCPTYAFHRQGVADRDIDASTLVARFPTSMKLMHTGGLALVPEDMEKILAATQVAKACGAIVSIDANLRPMVVKKHDVYIDGVRLAIRNAHIIKVSDEDLGILGFGDVTLAELGEIFFDESSVQLIALTRGAQGAALLTRTCQVEMAAPRGLAIVDTVGAGDCFHAGLISWLYHAGKLDALSDVEQCDAGALGSALRHAISSASLNIMRTGCEPATWEQTVAFSMALEQE